jgi:hypothetical protein
MSLPASIPRALPQTAPLIALLVELRESAERLSTSHNQIGSVVVLAESATLIEAALTAVHRVRESDKIQALPPEVAQAEAFALRELAAARRHHALASRSPETCRAACELTLRCLTRAVDTLLAKLMPHTLAPSGF